MSITIYAKGLTVEVKDNAVVIPPPPVRATGKYRNEQPYLFQTARSAFEPPRAPAGWTFPNDGTGGLVTVGPTARFIDRSNGWAWDRVGGDFLDKTGARNPATPVPWFSILTNAVTGNTAVHTYTVDVTEVEQFIQQQKRWNAFLILADTRAIATPFSSTPPSISVVYADTTTEVLKCRIVALNSTSTDYSFSTGQAYATPCFMEFEKPTKPVASASMTFTVTVHWIVSNTLLKGYVLDPSLNTDPVVMGGGSSDPSIIGSHRYLDGTKFSDFAAPVAPAGVFPMAGGTYNTGSEDWFDPAIYGNGPQNLKMLPHYEQGKWINAFDTPDPLERRSTWTLMKSTDSNPDGYKPLAPGVGAMRVFMPGNKTLVDGSFEYSALGHGTTGAVIYLPEKLWGIQELFVRYYVMLGAPEGIPYRMPIAKRLLVSIGGAPKWTDCTGKFGIMPTHDNTYGGFSGSAGGGAGWQMRLTWADITNDDVGPDLGGVAIGLHTYDFLSKNPPGHNYGMTDTPKQSMFGQRGGLGGVLYAGHWYCYEAQMKLNTVMDAAPGYVADGEIRQWIDGRLVLERTGMVFRTLPLVNPGYRAGYQRPVRNLGHRNLLFNWFHGGTTENTVDRSCYIAELAWGTKYIGPIGNI